MLSPEIDMGATSPPKSKFMLLDLLTKSACASISQLERQKTNDLLKKLGMVSMRQHIADLCGIIITPEIPESDPSKSLAAIYMKNYLRTCLSAPTKKPKAGDQTLWPEDLKFCAEMLVKLMLSPGTSKLRNSIQMSLEMILFASQGQQNQDLIKEVFGYLNTNYLQVPSTGDFEIIQGTLSIFSALALSCQDKDSLLQIMNEGITALTPVLKKVQIGLYGDLIDMNPLTIEGSIVQKSEVLQKWTEMFSLLMSKFKKKANKSEVFLWFLNNQETCQFLVSTLQINSESKCILSLSGVNTIDLALNQLKSLSLSCLKQIWLYLYREKPFENLEHQNIYVVQAQILQEYLVQTLITLGKNQFYHTLIQNGHIITFVKSAIKILICFSKQQNHSQFMTEHSFEIFIQVILPFLKISPAEVKQLEEDPEEFVNASADMVDNRESDDIKTQTTELLLAIDQNIDGMLTFIVDFCVQLLQKVVQKSNTESQQYITTLIEKFQLRFNSEDEIIEVSLMILAILSPSVKDRMDLQIIIDRQMENLIPIFLNFGNGAVGEPFNQISSQFSSPLIKQRMCMNIGLSFDTLLSTLDDKSHSEELMDQIVCWLFENISGDQSKVVQLQVLDSLDVLLSKAVFQEKIQLNFDYIIQQLVKSNQGMNLSNYFEFLESFIKENYQNFTTKDLKIFLQSLVDRVLGELQIIKSMFDLFTDEYASKGKTLDLSKKPKKQTQPPEKRIKKSAKAQAANQRIGKCMNVVRFVTEHSYFSGRFVGLIEETLKPLLAFAENPNMIDFEDDLIFFIDALIKKSKCCSPMIQEIFPYLKGFQIKYQGMLANLTSCLNSYIFFGAEFILKYEANVASLLDIISQAIMLKGENFSNNIEGCLVLQWAFQNFPAQQDTFYIRAPQVLKGIIDILKSGGISLCFKRNLCHIILSACIYDQNLVLQTLEETSFTQAFFSMVFDPQMIYRSYYERKIFIFGLCKIVFKSNGQPFISGNLAEMLKQIILMLIRQQRIEQNQKLKKEKVEDHSGQKRQAGNQIEKYGFDDVKELNPKKKKKKEKQVDKEEQEYEEYYSFSNEYSQLLDQSAPALFKISMKSDVQQTEESFYQEEYDLKLLLENMVTRIDQNSMKKLQIENRSEFADEFDYFNDHLRQVHALDQKGLEQIIQNQLEPNVREFLKIIVQTKRVQVKSGNQATYGGGVPEDDSLSRRIVKVKRRN